MKFLRAVTWKTYLYPIYSYVWKQPFKKIFTKIEARKHNRLLNDNTIEKDFFFTFSQDEWTLNIELFKRNINTDFPIQLNAKNSLVGFTDTQCSTAFKEDIIFEADQILKNKVKILDLEWVDIGQPINWQKDFKSGYEWDVHKYFKQIEISSFPGSFDIKYPWELSRMHYLSRLGQAYWLTNDAKYETAFFHILQCWIKANPYKLGVNWKSPMEVSIRSINLIYGLAFFSDSTKLNESFCRELIFCLWQHGKYISENLEGSPDKNTNSNHYLSNLVGLIYISIVCPFLKEANDWLEFATQQLWDEALKQFRSDGVNYEGSIPYHRLSTELYLFTFLLFQRKGIMIPKEVENRIKKAVFYTESYRKQNGYIPQIGDQDNGRLLRLTAYSDNISEWKSHDHLLALAGVLFDDKNWMSIGTLENNDIIWLSSPASLLNKKLADTLEERETENISDRVVYFEKSGILTYRKANWYLIVSAQGVGTNGVGNHSHNDPLSFELSYMDTDIVVDPGTGQYTGDYITRNRLRSVTSHNTVFIDNVEPGEINKKDLFRLGRYETPEFISQIKQKNGGEEWTFCALKEGGIKHYRTFIMDRQSVIVKDYIKGEGLHKLEFFLHFVHTPSIVRKDNNTLVIVQDPDHKIELKIEDTQAVSLNIKSYDYSPAYGLLQEEKKLVITVDVNLPFEFSVEFVANDIVSL